MLEVKKKHTLQNVSEIIDAPDLHFVSELVTKLVPLIRQWMEDDNGLTVNLTERQSLIVNELELLFHSLKRFIRYLERISTADHSLSNIRFYSQIRKINLRKSYFEILRGILNENSSFFPHIKNFYFDYLDSFELQNVRSKARFLDEMEKLKVTKKITRSGRRCSFRTDKAILGKKFTVISDLTDGTEKSTLLVRYNAPSLDWNLSKEVSELSFPTDLYKKVSLIKFTSPYRFLDTISWTGGRSYIFCDKKLEDKLVTSIRLFKDYLIIEDEESLRSRNEGEKVYQQEVENIFIDDEGILELAMIEEKTFSLSETLLFSRSRIKTEEPGSSAWNKPKIITISSNLLQKNQVENINISLLKFTSCISEIRFEAPCHNILSVRYYLEDFVVDQRGIAVCRQYIFSSMVGEHTEVIKSIGFWNSFEKVREMEKSEGEGYVFEEQHFTNPIINYPDQLFIHVSALEGSLGFRRFIR